MLVPGPAEALEGTGWLNVLSDHSYPLLTRGLHYRDPRQLTGGHLVLFGVTISTIVKWVFEQQKDTRSSRWERLHHRAVGLCIKSRRTNRKHLLERK